MKTLYNLICEFDAGTPDQKIVVVLGDKKIREIVDNSENIIRAIGGKLIQKLGQGSYGIAYRLNNGKVVKFTGDPEEANTSNELIKSTNKHVIQIYDVLKIKLKIGESIYAIIEEELNTNIDMSELIDDFNDAWMKEYPKLEGKRFYAFLDAYLEEEEYELLSQRAKELVSKYSSLGQKHIKFVEDIISAFKYLSSKQIIWRDLHSGNVGKRGDDYVIFDFGLSKSFGGEVKKTVEENKLKLTL